MGTIDYGHYIDKPVVSGPGTMLIPEGMSLHDTYIIGKEGLFTVNDELTSAECLPFNQIILEKGSFADICFIILPGISVEAPITVQMVGENAQLELSGVYLCGADEKISIRTEIFHRAPNCYSNQLINGIAGGTSQAEFYGKIIVVPDAQKTEAYQLNRNILFSTEAHVDTKPQLEIYADDVICNHGATVGNLNEDEQFYMRSRGIPEKEAKVLQAISFIAPVLNHVADEKDRATIQEYLETSIRNIF